jgi:hypothetical protein
MEPPKYINKFVSSPEVAKLKREAKRVGYKVVNKGVAGIFDVLDPDNGDAIVFKGLRIFSGKFHIMFSKIYWSDQSA